MQVSMPAPLAPRSTAQQPPGKMEKAAEDFESVLLGSLLESMAKAFSSMGEGDTLGSGDYSYMAAQALASGMAARGGIGIASLILKNLAPKVPKEG